MKCITCCTCFIIILSFISVLSEKHKNYGSFNIVLTRVEVCKGPKRKECGIYNARINNSVTIDFDFLINENVSPTKAKVVAISNGNQLMRLQLNNPCENMFVRPVFMNLFNATENCLIKKGHYTFSLDFQEALRNYYGGLHLYGLFAFRSVFFGDQCNFSCTLVELKISGNK